MLEAPYVGKSPEECRSNKVREYTVYFSMTGSVTVEASSRAEAEEIFLAEYSKSELLSEVDDIQVDDVD